MWKSKKNHTSFTKSFLFPESADPSTKISSQAMGKSGRGDGPNLNPDQGSQENSTNFFEDFINASSSEEESVSLRVLGI